MSMISRTRRIFACLLALAGFAVAGVGDLAAQTPAPPAAATPPATTAPPAAGTPPTATAPPAAPAATPPAAPPPVEVKLPPKLAEAVENISKGIESAEASTRELRENETELVRLRSEVEEIINNARVLAERLKPLLVQVSTQIEGLGPPPAKDQPPEAAAVAAERARLNATKASFDGAIKTVDLAAVRAKQLIDRITVLRYQMFTRNLFERRESPLSPAVWRGLLDTMPAVVSRIEYYGGDWMVWARRVSHQLAALGAAVVLAYAILRIMTGRLIARRMTRPETAPGFFERVFRAAWVVPLRMLAPATAVLMLYFGLSGLGLLFTPWQDLAFATFVGLLFYIGASALLTVSLAPSHPEFRLIPVSDRTARHIRRLLKAFIAIYLLDIVLVELGRAVYVPLAVTVAQSIISSTAFTALIVWLVLTPFVPQSGPDRAVNGNTVPQGPVPLLSPLWIKVPLVITAAMILLSSLLGYIALGRFIAHQVVLSGTVIVACGLLYLAIRAATQGRNDNRDFIGETLGTHFGFEDASRRRQLSRLVEFLATLMVALAALPLLMMQWGFSWADVRDWLEALLFGFEIGSIRISLARILIGMALFTAVLFATRMVQRWLRDNMLLQPRVDPGIANSVDTAVGYAGIGLGLLLALSYAGLDITSLAIVAGALSVGIGFGLQSIVNNFVSGLILLVERPVKVGDWIVVGTEQGNVRRISVRSTEIETFDRASLIIPNSELITGRVMNWTHRSQLGRAVIKVQVAPTADPDHVMQILMQCAEEHPLALKLPAPFTSFDNFSGTELQFTVGAVVADVYTTGKVATELRVSILKSLRENGIELANPQRDVHLKDLGWVKSAAARIIEQRSSGEAGRPAPPAAAGPPAAEDSES